ncbi:MAG: HEAT repeat domain-containing protein [Planctomycetota bacterium]|nr:MAG: HEAT repeat domain-containing protein [Planctomycetota bacterium]
MLSTLLLCFLSPAAAPHGGNYRPPPPPIRNGRVVTAGLTNPEMPEAPTPTATTPANPSAITPPSPTVVTAPQPGAAAGAATTGGVPLGPDTSSWHYWWDFNREPYLDLQRLRFVGPTGTGEADGLRGLSGQSTTPRGTRPSPEFLRRRVKPVLKQALASGQRDRVSAALLALTRLGLESEDLVQAFTPKLKEEQEIAETTALALGMLVSPQAMGTLSDLARDTARGRKLRGSEQGVDLRTRCFALYGLGLMAMSTEKSMVHHFVRRVVNEVLAEPKAAKDLHIAAVLAGGFSAADPEAQSRAWMDLMKREDLDFLVRAHLPGALARLQRRSSQSQPSPGSPQIEEEILVYLQRALLDRQELPEFRQSCAQALGRMLHPERPGWNSGVAALIQASTGDRQVQVRNFAVMALGKIAGAAGPDAPLVGQRILPHLLNLLADGSTLQRPWVALSLGVMVYESRELGHAPFPAVIGDAVLRRFRTTAATLERSGFAIGLGLMAHEASKEPLLEALQEVRDPQFRGYCAIALGLMKSGEAIAPLRTLLSESRRYPTLLHQVATALSLLQDRDAVPTLIDLLAPKDGDRPPLAVLGAAAVAVGRIGDVRAMETLLAIAQDHRQSELAKAFAVVALGRIADPHERPLLSRYGEELNYYIFTDLLTDPNFATGLLDIL